MNEKDFKITVFVEKDFMCRFALIIVKNESDAKDVTQEILLVLWKNEVIFQNQ